MKDKTKNSFVYLGWTLYTRDVLLKGGRTQTIYFFSKRTPKSGSPCDKPKGFTVSVNERTSLPYLRKINRYVYRGELRRREHD